ncbi:MAG: ribosome silencing factor [Bryobacteraceae bacterium]
MTAAEGKKAFDIRVLNLQTVTSFTDYFVICSVANIRQGQAVCDEIELTLKNQGERAHSIEGYDTGEWILMDYGDFLVHIFSQTARSYYDLERLWRGAESVDLPASTGSAPGAERPANLAAKLK